MHWRRKWQPTPVFLPGDSQGRGAWWATIYGVAQSWTRLNDLAAAAAVTWMDLEIIILSKVSETAKGKHHKTLLHALYKA